ncbi:nitrile hydratase subunit alpha [Paraburkholderia adhaesiva]|uniref:nitrile hydratase subunit alpha n=1 Tax=Paraburkholderia adhaesiva TaxID=2883244 RepID=UPI001F1D078A|nr:nitrile hydratase subunit alpha [Paraburkholderia adhaesiva]
MNSSSMETRVAALEALLKEKGALAEDSIPTYAHRTSEEWLPVNGARLCARAWCDSGFKRFLLSDGKAAAASMGFTMPEHHRKLAVKENTPSIHNVICCTLCSCTAFTIIGMAPGWYKDFEYRARIVREARTVLAEMGLVLPDEIHIRVWDTTTDTRYMILPLQPPYTAGWSEERLVRLVTKESLIGVQRLEPPFLAVQDQDTLHG